tara:strand:- start:183 stop:1643 length:1461 start_codon:yes stop_codon:yes gene_type:complete
MKSLGNIEGELLHRHFNDDTFEEFKLINQIQNLVVITYHPLNSLINLMAFLKKNFMNKSQNITLIFGLSNIPKAEATSDYDVTTKLKCEKAFDNFLIYLANLNLAKHQNLKIYLHTRCHIKALCADDMLYLGTQNVADTSNSFMENSRNYSYAPQIFNNHELILRIKKSAIVTITKIGEQLLKDEFSNLLIYSNGKVNPKLNFNDIISSYDKQIILEELKTIKTEIIQLKALSNEIIYSSSILEKVEIETQQGNYALELIIQIYEGSSLDYIESVIEDLLRTTTGECNFQFCEQISFRQIVDKLNLLSSLDTEVHVCCEFMDEISSNIDDVLECIEEPQIDNLSEEVKEDITEQIKKIIEDSNAYNFKAFFDHHRDTLENYLLLSPGESSNEYYVDDDEEEKNCTLSIIPIHEMTTNKKLDVLTNELNYLAKEILSVIYNSLEPQADEIINRVKNEIENIADNLDKYLDEHIVIPDRFERFDFDEV